VNPGSIVIVRFPFTSLEHDKKRPALVLRRTRYSPDLALLTVAMVTSQVESPEQDFCEPTIDKIGFLAPSSGSVTEWTIPGDPPAFYSCNAPVGGMVWFSNSTAHVRRLDPAANSLSTWACQMGCSLVYSISQESAGKVWFADATDLISFDPVAAQFVEYTGLGCGVYAPFVDGSGNIWTTQNGGGLICRFPPP
jgi:streptogramin lyase